MMIFERVVETARAQGRSIRSVERDAGLSANSIGKWRTHVPRVDSVQMVAQTLRVRVAYLLGEE